MNSFPANHAIVFAAALFVIGLVGIMVRRNLVFILMSLEIMLTAASIALAAAGSRWHQPDGQVFVVFILIAAAAEVAVGLALVLRIYHDWKNVDVDEVSTMKG